MGQCERMGEGVSGDFSGKTQAAILRSHAIGELRLARLAQGP